jgi:hypothetical protein
MADAVCGPKHEVYPSLSFLTQTLPYDTSSVLKHALLLLLHGGTAQGVPCTAKIFGLLCVSI